MEDIFSFSIPYSLFPIPDFLSFDDNTHTPGGTFNHLHGFLDAVGIKVRHLCMGDLLDLGFGDLSHLELVRFSRAFFDPRRYSKQDGRGRRFGDETE
jgi:hypothetical protein